MFGRCWSLLHTITALVLLGAVGTDTFAQPATDLKLTRQPIPLDGIPDDYRKLIDAGKVEAVYDSDIEFERAGRGWADFHWDIQRTFAFRYDAPKQNRFVINITKLEAKITLTHVIRIPASWQSPDVWTRRLTRHEFDHVAVSLDPRPRLLIEHLFANFTKLEHELAGEESASNELAIRLINIELDRRINAVREVMKQNNRAADRLSQHGTIAIPRRNEFFESLYSKQNLADLQFRLVDEVLPLLESAKYREAARPFVPLDPTLPWPKAMALEIDRNPSIR